MSIFSSNPAGTDVFSSMKPSGRCRRRVLENTGASGNGSSLLNCSVQSVGNQTSKQNISGNVSLLLSPHFSSSKKRPRHAFHTTPSKTTKKSATRFLSELGITPVRKTSGSFDRFIPNRVGMNMDKSHYLLFRDATVNETLSPTVRDFQVEMSKKLHGGSVDQERILSFNNKSCSESSKAEDQLFSAQIRSPSLSAKKSLFTSRQFPQAPERILDAPDIVNDYYLNLLDWSVSNHLAVALGSNVYLWNADNGSIHHLFELESQEDYVSSLRWSHDGNILAAGISNARVRLWDVTRNKQIRSMVGHSDRVGSLSWNKYMLSSGCRSGQIHHSDVRASNHLISAIQAHTAEVCGLSWSPDARRLASGGNDNLLKIWRSVHGERYSESNPQHIFDHHIAAVKAVSWCPWQSGILATGGGTADKSIKIWNVNNGTLLNSVDTKSQVCSIVWSLEYKELVSAHGFARNEVVVWKYPSMIKGAELLGHTDRVLHLALSADGTTVVSAGADETLRLWKCFLPDPNKKKLILKSQNVASSILQASIR